MSWDMPVEINDELIVCLDSGSYGNIFLQDDRLDGPRVCIPVSRFIEMDTRDFRKIQTWMKKNSPEIIAIRKASEAHWQGQFVSVDDLLLIINGDIATDEEKRTAKECLRNR